MLDSKKEGYETPKVTLVSLVVEQCIASSVNLGDMEGNDIYDEDF